MLRADDFEKDQIDEMLERVQNIVIDYGYDVSNCLYSLADGRVDIILTERKEP